MGQRRVVKGQRVLSLGVCLAWMLHGSLSAAQQAPAVDLGDVRVEEPQAGDAKPENLIELDIPGEEMADALSQLSQATGFSILASPKAVGKITAYITGMDAERALEETLKVNGLHYVRNGNVVWALTEEEYYQDMNLGLERRVIVLEHARCTDVVAPLEAQLSKTAKVIPYPETNVIVIAEQKERIDEVENLVKRLDQSPETRIIQLQHAVAADILPLLQSHVATPHSLQLDVRTNQVIVTDTPSRLDKISSILKGIDQPDQVATRVFELQYANADVVADIVREMLTGRRSSGQEGGFFGGQSDSQNRRPIMTTEPGRGRASTLFDDWRRQSSAPPPAPAAPTGGEAPSTPAAPGALAAPGGPGGAVATAAPAAEAAAGMGLGNEAAALGPLETVVSDSRTNSVIVTHTSSTLTRVAEVILKLDVPSGFRSYQFQNANPADLELETKLAPLLPGEGGYVAVDPATRTVTFRAGPEQAEEILGLLREWDAAIRQVRIEAEILSVSANLVRKLGVSWQAVLDEIDDGILDTNVAADVDFPLAIGDTDPQGRLQIGTLATDDYTAVIQALATDSGTQVIARPRVLVRDGESAIFSNARDEPYTVVAVEGETGTRLEDVRFLNVGVTLEVAPTINSSDQIVMEVTLEISDLAAIREGIPVVDRSTAQSVVTVRDGGTVLLGGLRKRSRTANGEGLPGLRKIPLFGLLFGNRTKDKGEAEIILILRPRLIGDTQTGIPYIGEVNEEVTQGLKEDIGKVFVPEAGEVPDELPPVPVLEPEEVPAV